MCNKNGICKKAKDSANCSVSENKISEYVKVTDDEENIGKIYI